MARRFLRLIAITSLAWQISAADAVEPPGSDLNPMLTGVLTTMAASQPDAPASNPDGDDLHVVGTLLNDFERAFNAQNAQALAALFVQEGVLHDWRGVVARSSADIQASYEVGFKELLETKLVTMEDGRKVSLQRYPPVPPKLDLVWQRISGHRDGITIDGIWRVRGVLSPSAAILPDFDHRGSGAAGSFRLNLTDDQGAWAIRHFSIEAPAPKAEQGTAGPQAANGDKPVLTYSREGGIVGWCHRLAIYADGKAVVATCRRDSKVERQLTPVESEQLNELLTRFGRLSIDHSLPAGIPDGMSRHAEFFGNGDEPDSSEASLAVWSFAEYVFSAMN